MRRCVVCRARPRAFVYQPWPDGAWRDVGRHLDGYPVVSVCDPCAGGLRAGLPRTFRWRGQLWTLAGGRFTLSEHHQEDTAMMTETTPRRFAYTEDHNWTYRYIASARDGSQYLTNRDGEGLWFRAGWGQLPRQITGTAQFKAGSLNEFKRKLRARLRA